ncbi:DegT/DnrJ/EryC1/StrS aminotransferase family protein [Microbacterium sp.]|uniref:DegT/DnrJ/EryC1/StrS family aminotransferase n=1 Tax=Microbacterium sp. TaxID=51671 RepID=UPI00273640F7|nr:DegT/DnrJ/EryC1/StrS family aminotransferase [Microbacterium sp.]MDP3951391.1 DegT/DnrJ/EryC1/StrS family aminotransferase [Microbacterium sp.]
MSELAIDGGAPLNTDSWPAWPPPATAEQRSLLDGVLESGEWGSTSGPLCQRLADRFAQVHDAGYGVSLTNGTIALFVALRAAGVGPGDEVIVPAYTFVACATSVLLLGATPVIADVDAEHLHLSAATIEQALSARTRAVMVVHLAGSPAPMTEIMSLAGAHDLVVIEDSAQAHGARYRERPVGGIGTAGTFSFQSSKAMTAGEGGLVVTNDAAVAESAWSLCNVGRERDGAWYHHATVGWNLRMTELQAALLLPWLDRLDGEIDARERFCQRFRAALAQSPSGAIAVPDPDGTTRNSRHLLMVSLPQQVDRHWVAQALAAEGVPVDLGYPALGSIDVIARQSRVLPIPNLTSVGSSLLWLRQSMLMADEDAAERAASAFSKVLADSRAWRNA